jgi:hypothetical protein
MADLLPRISNRLFQCHFDRVFVGFPARAALFSAWPVNKLLSPDFDAAAATLLFTPCYLSGEYYCRYISSMMKLMQITTFH